ncbi:hypothetical protein YB2330_006519 [Saitoella coloradoensis]
MAPINIYDLVVVGSGFAGTTTALSFMETAKEKNNTTAKVALLEVGKKDERAGASRWTMAYLRLDKNNKFDPNWIKLVEKTSKGLADLDYARKLEKEAPVTAQYILDRGVELVHHEEPHVALEFETDGSFAFPKGGGLAIVTALMKKLEEFENAEVMYETEAVKLSLGSDGRVNGVVIRGNDGLLRTLNAKNVMLACGGFEGNPEMLTQYCGPNAVDLPLIAPGLKYNRGAGIRMAMEIGAGTAGQFDMFHAECVDTRTSKPDAVIWGHNYGIVVNRDCSRFYDEGCSRLFESFELIAYDIWRYQNQEAYFVCDSVTMDRMRESWVYSTTDLDPERGETVEELARKLGINEERLRRTVEEYNKACPEGAADEFTPNSLDGKATKGIIPPKSNWALPIAKAPFYGYPLKTNLTFTYGGIKVDLDARVLSTNNVVIPGLWSAGEITGFFYHEYPPASSVLRSLTFGRLAGQNIANSIKG